MNLAHMRAFVAVVQQGSLRAAARELGISQPAVTKIIRSLETELGVVLLRRSTTGSSTTRFGEAFYVRSSVILSELGRAREEIEYLQGARVGNLAVGLSDVAAVLTQSESTRQFQRQFPKVGLRFVGGLFDRIASGVRDGTLDFGVVPIPGIRSGADIEVEHVVDFETAPLVRKGSQYRDARSLAELANAPWISPNPDGREQLTRVFRRAGLTCADIIECDSFAATFDLLQQADRIVWLPRALTRSTFVGGRMQEIRVEVPPIRLPYGIIRRKGVPPSPPAERLSMEFRRALEDAGRDA